MLAQKTLRLEYVCFAQEGYKDITWYDCKSTGMLYYSYENHKFQCSMFSVAFMSTILGNNTIIPNEAMLTTPYTDDWKTLEQVALVSLMVHIQANSREKIINLENCRPDAYIENKSKVLIIVPNSMSFNTSKIDLDNEISVETYYRINFKVGY
jgi:hypothetical protein